MSKIQTHNDTRESERSQIGTTLSVDKIIVRGYPRDYLIKERGSSSARAEFDTRCRKETRDAIQLLADPKTHQEGQEIIDKLGPHAMSEICVCIQEKSIPKELRAKLLSVLSIDSITTDRRLSNTIAQIVADSSEALSVRVAALRRLPQSEANHALILKHFNPISPNTSQSAKLAFMERFRDLETPYRFETEIIKKVLSNPDDPLKGRISILRALASQLAEGYGERGVLLGQSRELFRQVNLLPEPERLGHLAALLSFVGTIGGDAELKLAQATFSSASAPPAARSAALSALADFSRRGLCSAYELDPKGAQLFDLTHGGPRELLALLISSKQGFTPERLDAISNTWKLSTDDIIYVLRKSNDPKARELLVNLATREDTPSKFRAAAIEGLGLALEYGDQNRIAEFRLKLEELICSEKATAPLRDSSVYALSRIISRGDSLNPQTLEFLYCSLVEEGRLGEASERILLTIGSALVKEKTFERLSKMLRDLPNSRHEASALIESAPVEWSKELDQTLLRALCKSPGSQPLREFALQYIKSPGYTELTPILDIAKRSTSAKERFSAQALLARVGDPDAIEELMRYSKGQLASPELFQNLLGVRSSRATKELLAILQGPDDVHRRIVLGSALNDPANAEKFIADVRRYCHSTELSTTDKKRYTRYADALEKCLTSKIDIQHPARFSIDGLIEIVKNREVGPHGRVAVILGARHDSNGALNQISHAVDQLIARGYTVMYHEVENAREDPRAPRKPHFLGELNKATTDKRTGRIVQADALIVAAHGLRDRIAFGEAYLAGQDEVVGPGILHKEDIQSLSSSNQRVRKGASMCLISCSAGWIDEVSQPVDNMASHFRSAIPNIRPLGLIAPQEPTGFYEFQFDKRGRIIDAGFTTPRYFGQVDSDTEVAFSA